jgi:hypothetical protein
MRHNITPTCTHRVYVGNLCEVYDKIIVTGPKNGARTPKYILNSKLYFAGNSVMLAGMWRLKGSNMLQWATMM